MDNGPASQNSAVFDDQAHRMITRRCFIEFHPMSTRARLPKPFARSVEPLIGDYVFLQDQNENQIEVAIRRKRGRIYFTQGWSNLGSFYRINESHMISLLYINPSIFHMTIHTLTGAEVQYPLPNPPLRLWLPKPLGEGTSQRRFF